MDVPGIHPNFESDSSKRPIQTDEETVEFYEEITFEDFEKIESLSRIQSDEDIEEAVKDLLAHSHKIDSKDISVEVDACNVTLSGVVHSQVERDYALSVVKLISGVGDVHSNLVIKLSDDSETH